MVLLFSSWALVLQLAFLSSPVLALALPRSFLENRGTSLSWTPCFGEATANKTECTVFNTPLDYANSSAGNASLAVIRYKAFEQPYLGTLWMNPGGPGGSGLDAIAGGLGEMVSNITGGHYDIASWDPRGVGYTLPRVDCFRDYEEEAAFWKGSVIGPDAGFEVRGNFSEQADVDAFLGLADDVDTHLIKLGEHCTKLSGDTLKYVGTAAAVRDMVAMTDAIDGPGAPVNYWGISYGTVIGSYFVNMFPDRVGRVVIDGVVNPVGWAQTPAYKGWGDAIQDADKTLMAFAQACANAGKDACAISGGKNATEVYQWVVDLVEVAYDAHKKGFNITSADVRGQLFGAMYEPRAWDAVAEMMAQTYKEVISSPKFDQELPKGLHSVLVSSQSAEELNAELARKIPRPGSFGALSLAALSRIVRRDNPTTNDTSPDYSFQAIACSDAIDSDYTTTNVLEEMIRLTQQVSPTFGPWWGTAMSFCHRWPARAVERYAGPWNHTLRNPIAVIGNTADPITPLHSAKFVANQLGSSAVLIEQEGFGHSSFAMHSNCTSQTLAAYFVSGQLPQPNARQCVTDQRLFSPDENEGSMIAFIGNTTSGTSTSPTAAVNSGQQSSGLKEALPQHSLIIACAAVTFALTLSL